MFYLTILPLLQTIPEPPPINGIGEWVVVALVITFVTVVGAIPAIAVWLLDKKRGSPAVISTITPIVNPLIERIENLEIKTNSLEKKNGDLVTENKQSKNRIKTLETENKGLKTRIKALETENDNLRFVVRFTAPAFNKVLNDTTGGLNKNELQRYHELLNDFGVIV